MTEDHTTQLETGDLVYLSFSFPRIDHSMETPYKLVSDSTVFEREHPLYESDATGFEVEYVHPLRKTHALLLGRGSNPELEKKLIGESVGATIQIEVSWRPDSQANDLAEAVPDDIPQIRVPARTVEEALPEWLATIAQQENATTLHEFVDHKAGDIAEEYMLDREGVEEFQSELADEIDGWLLAEVEVVEAVRWRDAASGSQSDMNSTDQVESETSEWETREAGTDIPTTSADEWPMEGGNPSLTGMTATTIPTDLPEKVWETRVPGVILFTPIVTGSGVVIVDNEGWVVMFDSNDGARRWSRELDTKISAPPCVPHGAQRVFVGTNNGRISAINRGGINLGGEIAWEYSGPDAAYHIVGLGKQLIVRTRDGVVYALNRESGEHLWTQETFADQGATLVRIGYKNPQKGDDLLTRSPGWMRVIDPETGELKASADDTMSPESLTAVTTSETVITGDHTGISIRELQVDDMGEPNISEPVKRISLSGTVELTPAVTSSRVIVAMTSGRVYAVDPATGEEEWCVNLQDTIKARPVTDGETVLVGSTASTVYALNVEDGSVRWSIETDYMLDVPPAVAGGTIYVGDGCGNVTAYQ